MVDYTLDNLITRLMRVAGGGDPEWIHKEVWAIIKELEAYKAKAEFYANP